MEVFISRQTQQSYFDIVITKVLCPICTFTWRVSNYVFRQGKGVNRRIESTMVIVFCTDNDSQSLFRFSLRILILITFELIVQ